MKIFITADWHLGEDRFDLMQRPFIKPDEMVDTLVKNHNALVNEEDTVIVVGDVCYQKKPEYLKHVARFNGRKKILLRGNHDRVFTDEELAQYFTTIVPEGVGLKMDVAGVPCNIVHYPSLATEHCFNLVGHIHAAWKFQLNSLNVGVDANHFRPLDLQKDVPFFLRAISEFYDADVWAAYNKANSAYYDKRGKKSSYLDAKK